MHFLQPLLLLSATLLASADWRDLNSGLLMLQDAYLDQPQCTHWRQPPSPARWVCTIARNSHPEGNHGEHSEVLWSSDRGVSWTTGIRLEAPDAPTNSYGNILATDSMRLVVIYDQNLHNVSHFPNGQPFTRDDEMGFMVWRYSEDGGDTWSAQRLVVPLRNTTVDRHNSFNGTTQLFWSVDQVTRTRQNASLHAYTKMGTYMQSAPQESFFVSSPNLLSEPNASAVTWALYPEGDAGVRPPGPPGGMQWEEAHVVQLASQPGMFSVCRTSVGYLGAAATGDDSGASGWGEGHYATFSALHLPPAAGRRVKNPEGPITLKRLASGAYLLLFYFNSLPGYFNASLGRSARNPYWLAAGWEEGDGEVRMSQPEVALYSQRPVGAEDAGSYGPGYPDFIEELDGSVYITETNKTHARVHPIEPAFLALLLAQGSLNGTAPAALQLAFAPSTQGGAPLPTPPLPSFAAPTPQGLTLGLWLSNHAAALPGAVLVDTGGPLRLDVAPPTPSHPASAPAPLRLTLLDAATGTNASLTMDGECAERLGGGGGGGGGEPHWAAVVVDAAAHILTWAVDGVVCDGGLERVWGWEWVDGRMGDLGRNAHAGSFVLGEGYGGRVLGGGWWGRALMHSELVGVWRAGVGAWGQA